jgi:hypothetical protein
MEERMVAKMVANNEKFEVLQGTLLSWMGFPRIQDRSHAKENGCQIKRKECRPRTRERRN